MTILDRLGIYWSNKVAQQIACKTKDFLENQKDLTSGDDTCLENNWEEYCFQIQYEESFAWDAFIEHIELLFRSYFEELPVEEQFTLWCETEEGVDWCLKSSNRLNPEFKYENAPIFFEDCLPTLMSTLNEVAINYESANITNYVEYDCEGIEEEDEEEDDEEDI